MNKNLVLEFQKIFNRHIEFRNDLISRAKNDEKMKKLVLKLDHSLVNFMNNMSVKVGNEQTSQALRVRELIGLTLLEPLVKEAPECDFAGNLIKQYLQKLSI